MKENDISIYWGMNGWGWKEKRIDGTLRVISSFTYKEENGKKIIIEERPVENSHTRS